MSSLKIVYSICIPHVFPSTTEQRIREIFNALYFGSIERVDMVPKTDTNTGQENFRVFVHFSSMNRVGETDTAFQQLEAGEKVKIVYDKPWFWMISKSTSKSPIAPNQPQEQEQPQSPFIDFGDKSVTLPTQSARDLSRTAATTALPKTITEPDYIEARKRDNLEIYTRERLDIIKRRRKVIEEVTMGSKSAKLANAEIGVIDDTLFRMDLCSPLAARRLRLQAYPHSISFLGGN